MNQNEKWNIWIPFWISNEFSSNQNWHWTVSSEFPSKLYILPSKILHCAQQQLPDAINFKINLAFFTIFHWLSIDIERLGKMAKLLLAEFHVTFHPRWWQTIWRRMFCEQIRTWKVMSYGELSQDAWTSFNVALMCLKQH